MTTLPCRTPFPLLADSADRSALRTIDQQIGQELRAIYNEVLAEPIPDRLLALIDQLDSSKSQSAESETETIS